jgi:arabinose-5-phosphate isomerase
MIDIAKRVFDIEAASLKNAGSLIDHEFTNAVNAILSNPGKLIVSGIGKSGHIGRKIAATLSSTGTSSFFLHPGEAYHGDLGMVSSNDIILLISYSGETDEVLKIMPYLKWNSNKIISMTGNAQSTIAKNSDHHINISITAEACPLSLAPTSSTTTTLVMGDALAVALMEARGFQSEDFARFHPGGSLGRKLLVKVKDLMRTDNLPFVDEQISFTDLLLKMSEGRLGTVIVGSPGDVKGIITDGDLRRALIHNPDTTKLSVRDIMTTHPVTIDENEPVYIAEQLLIDRKITTVFVRSSVEMRITGVYQIYS